MNGNLAESSTFWELPGIFITFFLVASRACHDKMRNFIRRVFTANRERMVDMINVPIATFFKLMMAIIALISLSLQLLLNLCRRISARYTFFSRSAKMAVSQRLHSPVLSLPISFAICFEWLWIGFSTIALLLTSAFPICLSPFSFSLEGTLFVLIAPLPHASAVFFWISLAVLNLFCINTNFTSLFQPIVHSWIFVKVCFCKWHCLLAIFALHLRRSYAFIFRSLLKINIMSTLITIAIQGVATFAPMIWEKFMCGLEYFFTFTTTSVTFWKRFRFSPLFLATLLTSISQSISHFLAGSEEIFGGREKEFAIFALLLSSALKFNNFIGDLFEWLSIQIVKTECTLNEVFWYTVHAVRVPFLSSRPPVVGATWGTNHIQFSLIIIPRSRSPSNFIAILHA